MSKWVNTEKFKKFQEQKKKEQETPVRQGVNRSLVWQTPEKGSTERPKVYEGRFLPDKNNDYYKKYFYHMFRLGDRWQFVLCEKTFGMDNFCPFCTASSKLYMGTGADKKVAGQFKKKEKFVANFFVIDDPRDSERDDDKKVNNTVKLYEFPWKVEMKLKEEITNKKHGLGISIFDPGEHGYNFLLKVLATKKDKDGNVWPDYSMSEFTRRPSSLGTDEEIENIMNNTISLNEYISSMRKPDDEIMDILKKAMIWDIIESEWNRAKNVSLDSKGDDSVSNDDSDDIDPFNEDDDVDEDLLKELNDI